MSQCETANQGSTAVSRFFRRSSLRGEIAVILLIKLALVLLIKFTFFNNPVPEEEIEKRLHSMFTVQSSKETDNFGIQKGISHEQ